MKYTRFATSVVMSGSLALMSAGNAFAADSISDTGPGSSNTITESNTNTYSETNSNDITVDNTNDQTATSGDSTVSGNTNAGSASTGDATNNNTTTTTVGVAGSGSGNGGGVFGSGNGSGSGNTAGAGQGNGGGSVLGASTTSSSIGRGAGAEATLPSTGPSSPIDVSALRTQNHASAIPPALVKHSNGISAALLLAAATLSLLGAIGSAVYANRREQQL